jgi:hypothetical protein
MIWWLLGKVDSTWGYHVHAANEECDRSGEIHEG